MLELTDVALRYDTNRALTGVGIFLASTLPVSTC
jgi:hypothetical protein